MKLLVGLLLMFCMAGATSQTLNHRLAHDPFVKPALPEVEDEPETVAVNEVSIAAVPTLRGVLHSPRKTLVNIEGKLLGVGGRYERFTIVAVGERNAVLRDGEERHVISMDDPRELKNAPSNYR